MTATYGWRARYHATIDQIRRVPFEWGSRDCLLGLVSLVLEAIHGRAFFERFAGRYKSAKGALGVMKRSGFDNLADLAASELTEIHPSQAVVGDIAAIPTEDDFGYALGVVNGDRIFVLREDGLGTRDRMEMTRAFRVI